MKRNLIYVAVSLMFAHLLLEAAEIFERIDYESANTPIWPIVSTKFKPDWYVKDGILLSWWVKHNCDRLLVITTYMVMFRVAMEYSWRLSMIVGMFFGYHVADIIMMWWNWNSWHQFYWVLLGIILISSILIIWPVRNKSAIVKQLNI